MEIYIYGVKMKNILKIIIVIGGFALLIFRPPLFTVEYFSATDLKIPQKYNDINSTFLGIDVSHDQGQIDWGKVKSSNIDFVYHKATDGITYTDNMFHVNAKALEKEKIPFGAYHFFEPEDDPYLQAQNYIRSIKNIKLSLIPMVDVEIIRSVTAQKIKTNLLIFLNEIEKETGCKPMIYSYGDFWKSYITAEFNDYIFWLADYSKTINKPTGLKNLQLWQYSQEGKVSGIRNYVDLDVILDGKLGFNKIQCSYKKGLNK